MISKMTGESTSRLTPAPPSQPCRVTGCHASQNPGTASIFAGAFTENARWRALVCCVTKHTPSQTMNTTPPQLWAAKSGSFPPFDWPVQRRRLLGSLTEEPFVLALHPCRRRLHCRAEGHRKSSIVSVGLSSSNGYVFFQPFDLVSAIIEDSIIAKYYAPSSSDIHNKPLFVEMFLKENDTEHRAILKPRKKSGKMTHASMLLPICVCRCHYLSILSMPNARSKRGETKGNGRGKGRK